MDLADLTTSAMQPLKKLFKLDVGAENYSSGGKLLRKYVCNTFYKMS